MGELPFLILSRPFLAEQTLKGPKLQRIGSFMEVVAWNPFFSRLFND